MNGHHSRLRIGRILIDRVTVDQALDRITALVEERQGGMVFTPNVDHVVRAEGSPAFEAAYRAASLTLVDGMPLLWTSRLLGHPLPEKVSGSDLILPLMRRAAERHWRVYLFGATPAVATEAGVRLRQRWCVDVVGTDSPFVEPEPTPEEERAVARILEARPDIILVALGTPKQEIWMHRVNHRLRPTVALGVGAGLDFVAGTVRRAPRWVSRAGFEWLFRLVQEPRRLWRRYLVDDLLFIPILIRMLRSPRLDHNVLGEDK